MLKSSSSMQPLRSASPGIGEVPSTIVKANGTPTPGNVQAKYLNDAGAFPLGFVTIGDSWINYWRSGPNAFVGWNGPGSGQGAKSLGMELAQTRMFSECQVEQVFEKICYRTPNGAADIQAVQVVLPLAKNGPDAMGRQFELANGFFQRFDFEIILLCRLLGLQKGITQIEYFFLKVRTVRRFFQHLIDQFYNMGWISHAAPC